MTMPLTPQTLPTGRTPKAWAAGCGDQAQSATFRALAWSQDDDRVDEPLPYIGDEYDDAAPEADSGLIARISADAVEPPSGTRYSRSALLYGIATGFVAAAIGGLVLTVVNTDDGPTVISTEIDQPATNVVNPRPNGPLRPFVPSPANTVLAPAHAVPSAVAPIPAVVAPAPHEQTLSIPEVAAPEASAPGVPEPDAPAPEATAPEASAPEVAAPEAKPPVWVPPAVSWPVVSLPEVTPQQVPPPMGPRDFDLPTVADPAIAWPAAPAAPNPVLTVIPDVIVTFPAGAGR